MSLIKQLVLVIDLEHIAPESRFVEARNIVNRAINDGTLAEDDEVEITIEPEWDNKHKTNKIHGHCFSAKELSLKKTL